MNASGVHFAFDQFIICKQFFCIPKSYRHPSVMRSLEKMKIYLDNCSFNRPFDFQGDIKIRLESEAKLYIQEQIIKKELFIVWSYILDFENNNNPFEERKLKIQRWKTYSIEDVEENNKVIVKAKKLEKIGLKRIDALHLACAIYAKCDYFITTDKGILKKNKKIKEIVIIDPVNFVKEALDVD